MPDTRRHRGPHPEDASLFDASRLPILQRAANEFCYLLDRGYSSESSLKLVGDRHRLRERQRTAINRSNCSIDAVHDRRSRCVPLAEGLQVVIDGFNLLTTVESALAGGVIIIGREGCYRDMASMHGSYRRVDETRPALQCIGEVLFDHQVRSALWLLDEPVSNSGRLAGIIRELAAEHGWPWEVRLVRDPDRDLVGTSRVVISADREVIDGCQHWANTAAEIVEALAAAWKVELGGEANGSKLS